MTQYGNTLRDLARWSLGDAVEAELVIAQSGMERLPEEGRLDQAVDQEHVDSSFETALAIARALSAPERLGRVVGACAVDGQSSNDEACVADFIARFGARALRAPLPDEELSAYRALYGPGAAPAAEAFARVIAVMLSAPQFLYFVEHGEDAPLSSHPIYNISAYEIASRLSYHFWQTLPDDELWARAEDGTLLEEGVFAAQVERLLHDPRTRATMAELFSDWLALESLPALDEHRHDPAFAAFAGSTPPSVLLRQQMIDDVLDMLAHYTWTKPAGLTALLTSELSFAKDDELAQLYGVPAWDGTSAPPELLAGERPGLFTRALFHATGTTRTRPIAKGVRLRRQVLCDEIAPPPPGASALQPEADGERTTRQALEALTEQPGSSCEGCHARAINPLGFAFEGFDALGRARRVEQVFDEHGTVISELPVDTRVTPHITPEDAREADGPAELMALMLDSGKLEACLARHYFRFVFGRYEDLARDGCALERLRGRLVETDRLQDMLREAALLPELRRRTYD